MSRRTNLLNVLGDFGPPNRRRNPFLFPWRWRRELLVAGFMVWAMWSLAGAMGAGAAALIAALVLLGLLGLPPSRRFVRRRVQVARTEHRLRAGMVQAQVLSWSGWLPAILWSARRPRGVRITLWCPAGVDVRTFEVTRTLLAAACWAVDVEVSRHPHWAQLVVLLVVLRGDEVGS
ncbi:MAG: hypothetical protein AB7V23_10405 [Candidatus Nanopelagicales bacterium]